MQADSISSALGAAAGTPSIPYRKGRPDYDFATALSKVSPEVKAKAEKQSQKFEGMFINSMFSEMTKGIQGDGPFGNTKGTGIWRSMQVEQYSNAFAKAGGVGIAKQVYRTLILQQSKSASASTQDIQA